MNITDMVWLLGAAIYAKSIPEKEAAFAGLGLMVVACVAAFFKALAA